MTSFKLVIKLIIFVCILVICLIVLYSIFTTWSQESSNTPLAIMQSDMNYNTVINSYSNNRFLTDDIRNTAIVIIGNTTNHIYNTLPSFNTQDLKDSQLYNILTSNTLANFKAYIAAYKGQKYA